MNQQSLIRNFAIIAHIDHGKSTLADRLMELTGTVSKREMRDQFLDSNPIERERGITIKLAPVRMEYKYETEDNEQGTKNCEHKRGNLVHAHCLMSYILNLIDTPGHVDFTYEVSRSLAACEGALLVVDATQGVQAQTLANLHLARSHNLTIIPIINKIDLPNARIEETEFELMDLGFSKEEILHISAKTGKGTPQVLETIVERIPNPQGKQDAPTRALVFSSQYDSHKGVVVFVRIVDGCIGTEVVNGKFDSSFRIQFLQSKTQVTPIDIGYFSPKMVTCPGLQTGEVGYIATGLKDVRMAKVGDTITICSANREISNCMQPLPGYKDPKPMVFVGLFPIEQDAFTKSRGAMEKLRLSDSAFSFRPISSQALGNGFHCGFLGLLHAEIVQERLSREFGLDHLATAPSVEYQIRLKAGVNPAKVGIVRSNEVTNNDLTNFSIQSPSEFPDPTFVEEVKEPMMRVTIYAPKKYVGAIMDICQKKRGEYINLIYHNDQAEFIYLIPLSDMIVDFFDGLKSVTEGYASLDYEFFEYQRADVAKVDILVNHEKVDALSFLVVKEKARGRGKEIVERLSDVLPRQQFSIPVQAAIGSPRSGGAGGDIIARADIKPFRKDVIAKLYGGDRTRKDKLLKKQKKGKERMKMVGSVEIPQTAFFDVLRKK